MAVRSRRTTTATARHRPASRDAEHGEAVRVLVCQVPRGIGGVPKGLQPAQGHEDLLRLRVLRVHRCKAPAKGWLGSVRRTGIVESAASGISESIGSAVAATRRSPSARCRFMPSRSGTSRMRIGPLSPSRFTAANSIHAVSAADCQARYGTTIGTMTTITDGFVGWRVPVGTAATCSCRKA